MCCCCVFASDASSFKCTSIYRCSEPWKLQSYAILSHQSHLTKVWNLCMNVMLSNLASYASAPSYTIGLLFERKMQPIINAWDFVWQFASANCFGWLSHVHVGPYTMFTNNTFSYPRIGGFVRPHIKYWTSLIIFQCCCYV